MKRIISIILSMILLIGVLAGCGSSGTVETVGKKSRSENGGGNAYVFDIDKASQDIVATHKNIVTIYAYSQSDKNSIYFTDVYVDYANDIAAVGISNNRGFSGVTGTTIKDNTNIKVKDKNCYIRVGSFKAYMKNVNIKLTKVGQKDGEKGKASFSFAWAD